MADWEREKAFWNAPGRVDTYNLVHQGGYSEYNAMEKQAPGIMTVGEWVRAEDFRAAVQALESTLDRVLHYITSENHDALQACAAIAELFDARQPKPVKS